MPNNQSALPDIIKAADYYIDLLTRIAFKKTPVRDLGEAEAWYKSERLKLEASRPKPQSEVGLREALNLLAKVEADYRGLAQSALASKIKLPHTAADALETANHIKGFLARAALSQAPVPTREGFDTISGEDVEAIIKAAGEIGKADPKTVEAHRAAKKLFAPVPTSGAVGVAKAAVEAVLERGLVGANFDSLNILPAAAIIQQAMDEARAKQAEYDAVQKLKDLFKPAGAPFSTSSAAERNLQRTADDRGEHLKQLFAVIDKDKVLINRLSEALAQVIKHDVSQVGKKPFAYGADHPTLGVNPNKGARWATPAEIAKEAIAQPASGGETS